MFGYCIAHCRNYAGMLPLFSNKEFILNQLHTYSIKAPNTKRMHANIQASMAVSPSALGVLVVTVLKMLTSTRNRVTRRPILPGMTSIGIKNEIQDTITNKPTTQYVFILQMDKTLNLPDGR